MSVETSPRPLQVLSTRVFESGPPGPLVRAEQISTSKQEEWTTSKKKEELITKQIETRVQREILVDEDGEILECSGPMVTTNTKEDVHLDETETTEHKKSGADPPVGSGWVKVPGATVVNEKIQKHSSTHETHEERTDAEETEELGGYKRQELLRGIDSRGDLRAIRRRTESGSTDSKGRTPPPPPPQTQKKSQKVVETEEVREVSEVRDGEMVTESTRTANREEYTSDGPGVPVLRENKHETFHDTKRIPIGTASPSPTPSPNLKSVEAVKAVQSGVKREDSPDRTDAVTRRSLNYDEEEKSRRSETSRWIQSHFGDTPPSSPSNSVHAIHVKVVSPPQSPRPPPTVDDGTSPKKFHAIKDYFQSAVRQSADYYTKKGRSTSERMSSPVPKVSGSSSDSSRGHVTTTRIVDSRSPPPASHERARSEERVAAKTALRRSESVKTNPELREINGRYYVLGEKPKRGADGRQIQGESSFVYSTLRRGDTARRSREDADIDQSVDVARIINSLRSKKFQDANELKKTDFRDVKSNNRAVRRANTHEIHVTTDSSPKKTDFRSATLQRSQLRETKSAPIRYNTWETSTTPRTPKKPISNIRADSPGSGEHVIKIRVEQQNGVGDKRHFYFGEDVAGRLVRSRINSLLKNSPMNRSTPSLSRNPPSSPSPPDPRPQSPGVPRSHSTLALNGGTPSSPGPASPRSTLPRRHDFGSKGHGNSSSVWIGNDTENRRQRFMQGLLGTEEKARTSTRHSTSRITPSPPPLTRPMSPPGPSPSPRPFYYLGEGRSSPSSPVSTTYIGDVKPTERVEKTTKRKVTTTSRSWQEVESPNEQHPPRRLVIETRDWHNR